MNINRIQIVITRVETNEEGESSRINLAVFYAKSAYITKSEDYYWNRDLHIETINPLDGESLQFTYKLDSDDNVSIDFT